MNNLQIDYVYNTDKNDARVILINCENKDELEKINELLKADCNDYILVGLSGYDWNKDLSPWKTKAVFKNGEDFSGGGNKYLSYITNNVIPQIKNTINEKQLNIEYYAIAGYSLAGLFALYAIYNTDVFSKVVSASGSLWFDGFIDYAKENKISNNIKTIYLSLGDKEAKTKNPIMASVYDKSIEYYELYKDKINCYFELNEGNHFKDVEMRMAKGIKYILNN